jgi:hypothetical protein
VRYKETGQQVDDQPKMVMLMKRVAIRVFNAVMQYSVSRGVINGQRQQERIADSHSFSKMLESHNFLNNFRATFGCAIQVPLFSPRPAPSANQR